MSVCTVTDLTSRRRRRAAAGGALLGLLLCGCQTGTPDGAAATAQASLWRQERTRLAQAHLATLPLCLDLAAWLPQEHERAGDGANTILEDRLRRHGPQAGYNHDGWLGDPGPPRAAADPAYRTVAAVGYPTTGSCAGTCLPYLASPRDLPGWLGFPYGLLPGDPTWQSGEDPVWQSTFWRSVGARLPGLPDSRPYPSGPRAKPWPAPVVALFRQCQGSSPAVAPGACVEIVEEVRGTERRDDVRQRTLLSADGWVSSRRNEVPHGFRSEVTSWYHNGEHGAVALRAWLGLYRELPPGSEAPLPTFFLDPLDALPWPLLAAGDTTVERTEPAQALVRVTGPDGRPWRWRVRFDPEHGGAVSSVEYIWADGQVQEVTRFTGFVQAGGSWWATVTESPGEMAGCQRVARTVRELPAAEFAAQFTEMLRVRERSVLLRTPLPTATAARRAARAGRDTASDCVALLDEALRAHQVQRFGPLLARLRALAGDVPGVRLLSGFVYGAAGEFDQRAPPAVTDALPGVLAAPVGEDVILADILLNSLRERNRDLLVATEALRPVYARQPDPAAALLEWADERARALGANRRGTEIGALRLDLARQFPRDAGVQLAYAATLWRAGTAADGAAWLQAQLDHREAWAPAAYTDLVDAFLRLLAAAPATVPADLAPVEAWLGTASAAQRFWARQEDYGRYLAVLARRDRAAEADATAGRWLEASCRPGPLPTDASIRLQAALDYVLGPTGRERERVDAKWFDLLHRVAGSAQADPARRYASGRLARFRRPMPSGGSVEPGDPWSRLLERFDDLDPEYVLDEVVRRFYQAMNRNDGRLPAPPPELRPLAERLRALAERLPGDASRNLFVSALSSAYMWLEDRQAGDDLRHWQALSAEPQASRSADDLMEWLGVLLARPWSEAVEGEAFDVLIRVLCCNGYEGKEPVGRFVTATLKGRTEAALGARRSVAGAADPPVPEAVRQVAEADACRAVAARLGDAASRAGPTAGRWLDVERLRLEIASGRDPVAAATECRDRLTALLPQVATGGDTWEDGLLAAWYVHAWGYLAVGTGWGGPVTPGLVSFLQEQARAEPDGEVWKRQLFRLLLALDRPTELEADVRDWAAAPGADSGWRIALARLLAADGRFADAARELEALAGAGELRGPELRALAEWYAVLGQPERAARTRAASWAADPVVALQIGLYQAMGQQAYPATQFGEFAVPRADEAPAVLLAYAQRSSVARFPSPGQEQMDTERLTAYLLAALDSLPSCAGERVWQALGSVEELLPDRPPGADDQGGDEVLAAAARRLRELRTGATAPGARRALALADLLIRCRQAGRHPESKDAVGAAAEALAGDVLADLSDADPTDAVGFLARLGRPGDPGLAARLAELRSAVQPPPRPQPAGSP